MKIRDVAKENEQADALLAALRRHERMHPHEIFGLFDACQAVGVEYSSGGRGADRVLQRLRKAGRIAYDSKKGWKITC